MQTHNTIEIPLTKGFVAIIDADDADIVTRYTWYACVRVKSVYAATNIDGKETFMHRFLTKVPIGTFIDHKDGNGLHNCRANLRYATRSTNGANRVEKNKNNSSGYRGVTWASGPKKWKAQLMVNKKNNHLGYFDDKKEAALAYDRAARFWFGEFARTNFPD